MKKVLLLLPVLFFLGSCSFAYRLAPTDLTPKNTDELKDGYHIVTSTEETTHVTLMGEREQSELTLYISCTNKSGVSKTIIPEKIKVVAMDDKNQLTDLFVFSEQGYSKRLQNQRAWAVGLAAVNTATAVRNTMNAETTTTSRTNVAAKSNSYSAGYAVNNEGGYGVSQGVGATNVNVAAKTTTTTTGNVVAATLVQQEGNRHVREMDRAYVEEIANARKELLKSNTVKTGQTVAGKVKVQCKAQAYKCFRVVVPFGDESHTFTFVPAPSN